MIAERLIQYLRERGLTVSTAESCTGGNIAHQLTLVPGASQVFKGGVVSYCNEVKQSLLDVNPTDLDRFTAVSQPVAEQMAAGARKRLHTDCAISTTGVAGPDGGTDISPVGTVWIGIATPQSTCACRFQFEGDRSEIIRQATHEAIDLLLKTLNSHQA